MVLHLSVRKYTINISNRTLGTDWQLFPFNGNRSWLGDTFTFFLHSNRKNRNYYYVFLGRLSSKRFRFIQICGWVSGVSTDVRWWSCKVVITRNISCCLPYTRAGYAWKRYAHTGMWHRRWSWWCWKRNGINQTSFTTDQWKGWRHSDANSGAMYGVVPSMAWLWMSYAKICRFSYYSEFSIFRRRDAVVSHVP